MVTKTLLFKLQIIVDVRSIEVYDDFAFVIFSDESVLLAVRPAVEGQFAQYNKALTDVGDIRRGTLYLNQTPIQYYGIFINTSQVTTSHTYILNMLTRDLRSGSQYLSQEGIEIDRSSGSALFKQIRLPERVGDQRTSEIASFEVNSALTVIGYPTVSDGQGLINVLNSQTLELLYQI